MTTRTTGRPRKRTVEFVDAQKMSRLHPETFWAPSAEELAAIAPGWGVKVCAMDVERFWLKVTAVDGDHISGTVDNVLVTDVPLRFGELVHVERRHVYDYTDPNELVA